MQLNVHRPIRQALTAATAALVGGSVYAAGGQSETSVLLYSERDRVHATEIIYSLNKGLKNSDRLSMRMTFDGLSGASPTGGSPSKRAQTITRPSGGSTVVVPAGQLPLDDGFRDTRFAIQVGLSRRLGMNTLADLGISGSSEHDYKSLGVRTGVTLDFNDLHTTLGVAASYNNDTYSPLGGVPTPFTSVNTERETDNGRLIGNGSRRKRVYDLAVNLSQVLSGSTLARLSYSFDYSEGYLTDPYKVVAMVQPLDSADAGEPTDQLYEHRPNRRQGHSGAVSIRTYTLGALVQTGYRYYRDDWAVQSHTADLAFKVNLSKTNSIEPRVRWYRQSRANFSRPFVVQGTQLPVYVSADARLAKFDALTYGLGYSFPTSATTRMTLGVEWYRQRGDQSPPETFGPLTSFELFPNIHALMLRATLLHDIL